MKCEPGMVGAFIIKPITMSHEDLQKKYDQLLDKVRQMRGAQKEYFKYRAKVDLDRSKRLEREVDHLIDEAVKVKKSGQTEMF